MSFTDADWDALDTENVAIDDLVFTLQDLSVPHLFPEQEIDNYGPIRVQLLDNGTYFVHNGRHRVIRAKLNKMAYITARVRRYQ